MRLYRPPESIMCVNPAQWNALPLLCGCRAPPVAVVVHWRADSPCTPPTPDVSPVCGLCGRMLSLQSFQFPTVHDWEPLQTPSAQRSDPSPPPWAGRKLLCGGVGG